MIYNFVVVVVLVLEVVLEVEDDYRHWYSMKSAFGYKDVVFSDQLRCASFWIDYETCCVSCLYCIANCHRVTNDTMDLSIFSIFWLVMTDV